MNLEESYADHPGKTSEPTYVWPDFTGKQEA